MIIKNKDYKFTPIFVTQQEKEEYEKVENLTKKEIGNKVMEMIRALDEQPQGLYFEYFQKEVRNKKKTNYVNFYKVLQNVTNDFFEESDDEVSGDNE